MIGSVGGALTASIELLALTLSHDGPDLPYSITPGLIVSTTLVVPDVAALIGADIDAAVHAIDETGDPAASRSC